MNWKILAVDLDGTLMAEDGHISPTVIQSLHQARERGVHVILATGRAEAPSLRYAHHLGLSDPVICYQGGMICLPGSGEVLYERTMPIELAAQVARWGRAHQRHLLLFADGQMWIEERHHPDAMYDRWIGLPAREVPSLAEWLHSGRIRRVLKFIDFLPEDERSSQQPEMAWRAAFGGQAQIVRSDPKFVEITAPGVTKGEALAWLARTWEIPREQVIAVGDAENDLAMIEWAGLGIAMGQANARVQAAADWVAPPIDEDGVAAVIARFILDGVLHG